MIGRPRRRGVGQTRDDRNIGAPPAPRCATSRIGVALLPLTLGIASQAAAQPQPALTAGLAPITKAQSLTRFVTAPTLPTGWSKIVSGYTVFAEQLSIGTSR